MANHWLLKSEPGCFSIQDLAACPDRTTAWDGVRNFQARNFLRDQMGRGDLALFYHSVTNPAVVGLAEIVREGYPDPSAWDPADRHFDPKSTPDKPLWYMVDIRLLEIFSRPLPLSRLRAEPGLGGMELLRKGSRLSVQPVSPEEFRIVLDLAKS